MRKTTRTKKSQTQYKATRDIDWGNVFTLKVNQEFTEADLLPGMEAALAKWLRVGAAVEVEVVESPQPIDEEQAVEVIEPPQQIDEQMEVYK